MFNYINQSIIIIYIALESNSK